MYFRIMGKLNARRNNLLEDDEKGFTLIELLVVVIIIGILAAIAIPIYIGIQNNAKDSAVKSDLTNDKTALIAAYTANPSYTGALPANLQPATLAQAGATATLGSFGATQSANYSLAPTIVGLPKSSTASWTSFCINATDTDTGDSFNITSTGGVTNGLCS